MRDARRPVYDSARWPGQRVVTLLAFAYLTFAIYGSLIPLNYQPQLAAERLSAMLNPGQFDWSLQSRADVATNILLAIPLAFLWCAVITSGGRRWQVVGPLLIWAFSVSVSIAVEWLQIFFPPREPSLVDLVAQFFGAGLSVVFWFCAGRGVIAWFAAFPRLDSTASLTLRLLILYSVGLFAYGLLPLDLTLSLAELYRKWRDGRVVLLPFLQWQFNAHELHDFATDMALWIPVGVLAKVSFNKSALLIVLGGVFASGLLEFLQLFVQSRTSDSTQVVAAALGVAGGVGMVAGFSSTIPGLPPVNRNRQRLYRLAALLGWFGFICTEFWYPYNFTPNSPAGMAESFFSGLPMEQLFYQTELRAATELLRKTLFFVPLGILLAFVFDKLPQRRPVTLVVVPLLAAACLVEYGKLFLPGRYPGGTNVAIEFVGGLLGYWAARAWLRSRPGKTFPSSVVHSRSPLPLASGHQPTATSASRPSADRTFPSSVKVGLAILLLGTLLWGITKLPQIPYHFRRLPHPAYPFISMVLIAAAMVWLAGFPAWITRRLATDARSWLRYPLWLLLCGVIAWLLIFFALDAGVSGGLWRGERFLAPMSGVAIFAVLGCIVGGDHRYLGRRLAVWLLHAVWLLPLVYWGVTLQAANDDVVKLLAGNGSAWAAGLVGLCIAVVFFAATQTHALLFAESIRRRLLAVGWIALSFPLGYWLLSTATEPVIIKLGKVFSAMQIILGADPEHYAQGWNLFVRYGVCQLLLVIAAALGRWLFLDGAGHRDGKRGAAADSELVAHAAFSK